MPLATQDPAQYLEIGVAARLLGISGFLLRKLESQRKIAPPLRTSAGRRLFTYQEVEAIRAVRAAASNARQVAARA
jgi:DNA-binding transcriptional MerR regulator